MNNLNKNVAIQTFKQLKHVSLILIRSDMTWSGSKSGCQVTKLH